MSSSLATEIPELNKVLKTEPAWTTMILGTDRRIVMGPCRNGTQLGVVALVPDSELAKPSQLTRLTRPNRVHARRGGRDVLDVVWLERGSFEEL